MTASVTPFALTTSLDLGTLIIFTVAAFFLLCAVVSYFVATGLENNRRAPVPSWPPEVPDSAEPPGDSAGSDAPVVELRHLEWPGDASKSGDDKDDPSGS